MPLDSIGSIGAIATMPVLPAVNPTSPTSAALPGVLPAGLESATGVGGPLGTTAISAPSEAQAGSFGSQLAGQVDSLQTLQGERDTLSLQAVTGDLEDIHKATIAAAEASATMDLMVAMRNSGLQAFNELMRIQA
ncbi:flagellar hook-basal body complex protein FliE [Citricoccus alkalitolerans]|uniref:Flagellar hook-basal body complex protein FliE n=1 Tax=Citricoccus alkalitolerans TaxID=246603 RepID=A0ABV8XVI1_9MICC